MHSIVVDGETLIGIGEPRGSTPPTPPCIRVRTRRFDGLSGLLTGDGREAERFQGGIGDCDGERGAVAESPGPVRASGGLSRQVLADAAPAQLRKAVRPRFHCFQAMARSRRLTHWSRLRDTDGVSQMPK